MDGYINTYFNCWKGFLKSLVHSFEKHNIVLRNPSTQSIYLVDVEGRKEANFQELLQLTNFVRNNQLSFQFWVNQGSDIFTTIKKKCDILEFTFYLDGLEYYEMDMLELAIDDFIKCNRKDFLLKILDPKGYHEGIDWFDVMLAQYRFLAK